MSCCGLRAQITSLNSLFQKVHLNEVKPRIPRDPRIPALGYPKANSRPGKNSNEYQDSTDGSVAGPVNQGI